MRDAIAIHEPLLRISAFLGIFALMALWEAIAPRRSRSFGRRARWPHNLALLAVDLAVIRVLAPGAAIAVAAAGEINGRGLLNVVAPPASNVTAR